ncbi:MAG: PH domain-containing protein [Nanoarchaeota archaeon]
MSDKIKLKIRPSRIGFLGNYILAGIFGGAYSGFTFFSGFNILITILVIAGIVMLLLETEIFLLSKRWHITPEQIYFIDGIVKKSRSGIFLSTMTNVEVRQSGLERFLNVGKIEMHGFQKDGPIVIPGVKNPEFIANQIEKIARGQSKAPNT